MLVTYSSTFTAAPRIGAPASTWSSELQPFSRNLHQLRQSNNIKKKTKPQPEKHLCLLPYCMEEVQTSANSTNQAEALHHHHHLEALSCIITDNLHQNMVALSMWSRTALLFTVLMCTTVGTWALPPTHAQTPDRNSPPVGEDTSPQDHWRYPYIPLRYWSIQMLSAPDFDRTRTEQLDVGEWTPLSQPQIKVDLVKGSGAMTQTLDHQAKRNIVVADDAAFREKSKLLTAMERQKWLNSYMQKLLVVNSK
ncbi:tuberoinfundibular peptide of 39 residues [Brachyhypopomus gauderio]|uniref:tuberoinfundibular peptide of 39 residues n=1 Tax=Brachyhypopomus gauderio TaxID=698409 RepID=UPI004041AEFF